jgi:hypothetical protein
MLNEMEFYRPPIKETHDENDDFQSQDNVPNWNTNIQAGIRATSFINLSKESTKTLLER